MFKLSFRQRAILIVVLCCVLFGLLCERALWSRVSLAVSHPASVPTHTTAPLITTVSIPAEQDLFIPFILAVPLHTTVTWWNDDMITHIVTTTAQHSNFLNPQTFSFHIPAGKQQQITFNEAGLYHYYDSTISTWNTGISRVEAKKGTPYYPLAMDGIIWVQGPINGFSASAVNSVIAGHDEFAHEFVAIHQQGGVTWHNLDEDPHFVGLVDGWTAPINPTDIGLYRIAGTDDTPGGASITVLFNTPGLYYYYCRNHDQVDSLTHRAQALPMASEYPVPMEGFVLVEPI
ncbi:MAG TPA: hypothetical protein DHW02_00100 [Ktedonobacter sp.]|nr:hypothetical protein [Ktedonobacter sp.]